MADVRPSGQVLYMEDLFEAGGVPAVLKELAPLLASRWPNGHRPDARRRNRRSWQDVRRRDVVRPLHEPLAAEGGIAVLRGNLCPRGAVIKQSGRGAGLLLKHIVAGHSCSRTRKTWKSASIRPISTSGRLTCSSCRTSARSCPGCRNGVRSPCRESCLDQRSGDMVRISDARMSGTAQAGTVVLHVCPEAAIGGPLALVRDGDLIELDVSNRSLNVKLSDAELVRRKTEWKPEAVKFSRGYGRLFVENVLQADEGCDFDFLRGAGM